MDKELHNSLEVLSADSAILKYSAKRSAFH